MKYSAAAAIAGIWHAFVSINTRCSSHSGNRPLDPIHDGDQRHDAFTEIQKLWGELARFPNSPDLGALWDNAIDLYRFPDGYLPDESSFTEGTAAAL